MLLYSQVRSHCHEKVFALSTSTSRSGRRRTCDQAQSRLHRFPAADVSRHIRAVVVATAGGHNQICCFSKAQLQQSPHETWRTGPRNSRALASCILAYHRPNLADRTHHVHQQKHPRQVPFRAEFGQLVLMLVTADGAVVPKVSAWLSKPKVTAPVVLPLAELPDMPDYARATIVWECPR